ncbi:D-alanyl-D-alanine carboxypeptidase [Streptomyces sp. M92]|uniref:D-alanyl-D-alanine carboxypeptidase n=1 Tax=Streptomyces sp. M92 TaxID=2944250 RepID=UPI00234984B7|nr:D-alanyl-D-alanine carboxypeptidase [Streptomyces sp. M92]WCN03343.1 D-alanyl-D-alanine carboxypeptidase [Streptomyces sp. M92]
MNKDISATVGQETPGRGGARASAVEPSERKDPPADAEGAGPASGTTDRKAECDAAMAGESADTPDTSPAPSTGDNFDGVTEPPGTDVDTDGEGDTEAAGDGDTDGEAEAEADGGADADAKPAPPVTGRDPDDAEGAAAAGSTEAVGAPRSVAPEPARSLATGGRPRALLAAPLLCLALVAMVVVQVQRPLPHPVFTLDVAASASRQAESGFSLPWPEKGQAAVAVEGLGTVGTFGEQRPVPTASIAKIMTAYVILREHPLAKGEAGPAIRIDARAVEDGKAVHESRITGLEVGQTFSQRDMLKMLMIPSGNNIARLLARWDTGAQDEAAFVDKMNEAAEALGMANTTYTDPSGLAKDSVSTAVDQLKLAHAVMKFEAFREVVALPNADIEGHGRIYNNNDRLLMAGLGIRGIKTGSSTPAGGTLVWAAYKTVDGKDRLILGAMMAQHVTGPDPNGANSLVLAQDNSREIVESVRDALASTTVVRKGDVVGHVDDGFGRRTPVVAARDLTMVSLPGLAPEFTFDDGGENLAHSAAAGTLVGELVTAVGDAEHTVPAVLESDLTEPSFGERLTRIG